MRSGRSKPLRPGQRFFFARIFPLIFVAAGAAIVIFGGISLFRAFSSSSWPTANGQVHSSSIKSQTSSSGSSGSSTTYRAVVNYKFKVDDKEYTGDTVAYGDYGSSDTSHASSIVQRYPAGTQVTVSYMPENPEECVLEPGIKLQAWFMPGFGMIFLGFGLAMAIFLPRSMLRRG